MRCKNGAIKESIYSALISECKNIQKFKKRKIKYDKERISYKTLIFFEPVAKANLSHQKAHANYGKRLAAPLNLVEQQAFLAEFTHPLDNKTAVVAFVVSRWDEFSVCEKPTPSYGRTEKNTRPTFKTDEKKERAPTDS